jgi:hypothetical protein
VGRHHHQDLDLPALDGGEDLLGIEAAEHAKGAAGGEGAAP